MWSTLKNRDFFWLWTGQAISLLGDGLRDWAVIYWVFQASGQSPAVQSLAFMAVMGPMLLVSPWAGVLVDRWDRRKVMIWADLIRGGLTLLKMAAVLTGNYWIVLGLVFLGSSVAQFFGPARNAMIPRVVGSEHLVQANSLSQSTRMLMQLLTPGMGTAIYMLLGPMISFALDAVTFLVSAICISLVRTPGAAATEPGQAPSFMQEFRDGLRFCWTSGPIRSLITGFTVAFMGAGAINTLTIFIATKKLGLPESVMSYFSTGQTVAMLAVSLVVGSLAAKLKRTPMLIPLGLLVASVGIAVVAAAPSLTWMVGGAFVVGIGTGSLTLGSGVTKQALVPDAMRGRAFGVINSLPMVAMMASSGLAGALATTVDVRLIVGVAAAVMALAVPITYAGLKAVEMPGTRRTGTRASAPAPAAG